VARILFPGAKWYDLLSAVGYYGETVFEKTIRQHLGTLFPSHYVIPFKKDITSVRRTKAKRPDLLMIQKDLSRWTVVEVEMSNHNINHVLAQTKVFVDGNYNAPDLAQYAAQQLDVHCGVTIPESKVFAMMNASLPSVLVLADAKKERWRAALRRVGVDLCIMEIYKSLAGFYAYRIHGQYPIVKVAEAHCRHHPSLANTLEILGAFAFEPFTDPADPEISAVFLEEQTRWGVVVVGKETLLRFRGQMNPLAPQDTYRIFIDQHKRYHLEKN
jgi:hypothetical protein